MSHFLVFLATSELSFDEELDAEEVDFNVKKLKMLEPRFDLSRLIPLSTAVTLLSKC